MVNLTPSSQGNHTDGYDNGSKCLGYTLIDIVSCSEGGGDAGGDGTDGSTGNPNDQDGSNPGDNTSGGGGGSGSGNSPTPNPIVSTPVVLTMAEQLSEFLTLNDQQVIWANKQDQTTIDKITSFMLTNCEQGNNSEDCSQAEEFVLQAILAILDSTNDIDSLDDYIDSYFELNPEEWIVYEETPGNIIDLNEYLNCFNNAPTTATFKLSIFVDQPVPNQDDTWTNDGTLFNPDINVGHTFMSLEMNSVGNTINQTIGYYPSAGVSPSNPQIAGAWVDDGNHDYDVSASIDLTHTQFTSLISNLQTFGSPTYNLNTLNCTDAALLTGNSIGMNLPDTNGTWIGGGGSNPGNLGQDIRGLSSSNLTINTTSGTAALSEGPCN